MAHVSTHPHPHHTHCTPHRTCTPVNRSHVAQDTAHNTQHTEQAHSTPVNRSHEAQDTAHATQHTPCENTPEREPSGPGHRIHHTTRAHRGTGAKHQTQNTGHRARTPVNRGHVAQDTADTAQHTTKAHRRTGAKRPKTPRTRHRTPSVHTGEQEQRGPEHRAHHTTHHTITPVNRSQGALDTKHKTPHTERAHR